MDKITVKDLVDGYNSTAANQRSKWLKETVVVNKYVPWSSKVASAKAIVDASCFDENMNFHVDSPKRTLLTAVGIFTLYTNIDFDTKNVVNDWDILSADGDLVLKITNMINSQGDSASFENVVNMVYEDAKTNEYEPHAFITKKLMDMWPHISEVIMPLINKASDALDKVDENTFKEIVQTINR